MMTKGQIIDWLKPFSENEYIAIDEGGLALVPVTGDEWLEVGGVPDPEPDAEALTGGAS